MCLTASVSHAPLALLHVTQAEQDRWKGNEFKRKKSKASASIHTHEQARAHIPFTSHAPGIFDIYPLTRRRSLGG